jgi:hypothetical protein
MPCPDCFTCRERAPLPIVQAVWAPGQIFTGLERRKSLALTRGPSLDHPAVITMLFWLKSVCGMKIKLGAVFILPLK